VSRKHRPDEPAPPAPPSGWRPYAGLGDPERFRNVPRDPVWFQGCIALPFVIVGIVTLLVSRPDPRPALPQIAIVVVVGALFFGFLQLLGMWGLRDIRRRQGLGPYLPRRLRRRPTLRGWRR